MNTRRTDPRQERGDGWVAVVIKDEGLEANIVIDRKSVVDSFTKRGVSQA